MSADTARGAGASPAQLGRWWHGAGVLAILAVGAVAWAPALSGNWVWDDHAEIIGNKLIQDPAGLPAIWRGATTTDYFPLKTSLQWLQWRLWGDNPVPYHVTNVALHLVSALLVWRLFRRLGAAPVAAWLGGLAFAVHPLAVESVAWIAEFKNAVSLPPLLLATLAFIRFSEQGSRRHIAVALGWFLVAALGKTSVLMLPPALLLYSWWRDGTITRRHAAATAPFFAISVVLGAVTIWFQHARAMGTWDVAPGGPGERVGRAGAALLFYFAKSVLPVGLLPVYPRSVPAESGVAQIAAWLVLFAMVAWCWRRRGTWGRWALLGLGWFGLHLLPVVGLLSMAYLHFAWVADHFAYISLIGVIGLAVGTGMCVARRWPGSRPALVAAAALLIGLGVFGTRRHAALFANEETLWRHTLARNPSAWVAHNNLAVALARAGNVTEALAHATRARELKPDYSDAHLNVTSYLARLGRIDEAQVSAARAESLGVANAEMYSNLGAALLRAGRIADAVASYERGLRLDPVHAKTHKDYGVALFLSGRAAAAVEHYERGLEAAPDPQTHMNCGVALAALDRLPEAIRHYEAALRLAPNTVDAHYNYGIALARSGRPAEAQANFEAAVKLNPGHAEAYFHLGETLLAQARASEAVEAYRTALRLRPGLAEPARRLEQLGRAAEAAR